MMFVLAIENITFYTRIFIVRASKLSITKKLFLYLIFSFCLYQNGNASELSVQKGILDLHNQNLTKNVVFNLNGKWEYFPGKFYSPEQFYRINLNHSERPDHPIYVDIPQNYLTYTFSKRVPSNLAYGTLRCRIILPKDLNHKNKLLLAINVPGIISAYRLWIDSTQAYQLGNPGTNSNEHQSKIKPFMIPFYPSGDTICITIQVANYLTNTFLIWEPLFFGTYEEVSTKTQLKDLAYEGGAVFCCTLGIYFFFLFLNGQERKINLLFAISCFIIGLRFLVDKGFILTKLVPDIDAELALKLLLLCLNFFPVLLWTTYLFFPQEINQKLLKITIYLYLIYSIIVILLPTYNCTLIVGIIVIISSLILIYNLCMCGVAYYRKRESAAIFFYGTFFAVIFYFNMFGKLFYIPIGAFLLLILQATAITRKFVRSHKRVIQLSEDLQVMNENLEYLVVERTKELNSANESLRKLNFAKDRFISILSHDLRNPLNSLIGLSRRLFTNAEKNDTEKVISYSKMINESATTCHALAENLLDWSLIQSGTTSVIPHKVILKEIVDIVFDLVKNESMLKSIALINIVNDNCEVYADARMTESILRNLITNSIKFTHKNGKIEVSAIQFDTFWQISISDNGIGMDKDDVKNLFKIDKKVYNLGTNDEPGSGFGLILTKELIKSNGGSISVKSEKEKGTVVTFSLPDYSSASSKINMD